MRCSDPRPVRTTTTAPGCRHRWFARRARRGLAQHGPWPAGPHRGCSPHEPRRPKDENPLTALRIRGQICTRILSASHDPCPRGRARAPPCKCGAMARRDEQDWWWRACIECQNSHAPAWDRRDSRTPQAEHAAARISSRPPAGSPMPNAYRAAITKRNVSGTKPSRRHRRGRNAPPSPTRTTAAEKMTSAGGGLGGRGCASVSNTHTPGTAATNARHSNVGDLPDVLVSDTPPSCGPRRTARTDLLEDIRDVRRQSLCGG
jgi:hypothetical protein